MKTFELNGKVYSVHPINSGPCDRCAGDAGKSGELCMELVHACYDAHGHRCANMDSDATPRNWYYREVDPLYLDMLKVKEMTYGDSEG